VGGEGLCPVKICDRGKSGLEQEVACAHVSAYPEESSQVKP
jgi:hypothetical protein